MNKSNARMYSKMCKLYENGEVEKAFILAKDLYYNRLTLLDNKNIVIDTLVVLYEGSWNRGKEIRKLFPMLTQSYYTIALEYMDLELKIEGSNPWGEDTTDKIEGIVLEEMNL